MPSTPTWNGRGDPCTPASHLPCTHTSCGEHSLRSNRQPGTDRQIDRPVSTASKGGSNGICSSPAALGTPTLQKSSTGMECGDGGRGHSLVAQGRGSVPVFSAPQRQDGGCIESMPLALESGEGLEFFEVLAVRKVRLRQQRPAKPHLLPSYMWYYEEGMQPSDTGIHSPCEADPKAWM